MLGKKDRFIQAEMDCWDSIYGAARGPTSKRMEILVRDFEAAGLPPVMMRIGDQMLPYERASFTKAIRKAIDEADDGNVQAYYHPNECAKVVGAGASIWTHWGLLILVKAKLMDEYEQEGHPALVENVPRVTLPPSVRKALGLRDVVSAPTTRLLSCRVVAFFIAAAYESWATPSELAQVTPFKKTVKRAGFEVRSRNVIDDASVAEVLAALDSPEVEAPVQVSTTVAPPTVVSEQVEVGTPPVEEAPAQTNGVPDIDSFLNDVVEPMHDDLDAEIAAAEARVRELRHRKEQARIQGLRGQYMRSRIVAVDIDDKGNLTRLTLQTADGAYTYQTSLLPEHTSEVLA